MKAIAYANYGPPEVLVLEDVEKPVAKDDEVLIRVRAAEATKSDVEIRRFKFAVKWFWLPLRIAFGVTKPRRHILGGYFSGEIASVGKEVSQFTAGEQVGLVHLAVVVPGLDPGTERRHNRGPVIFTLKRMHQAPTPLLLRAYSGRENGLMVIGTPDELRRLGQQLIAVDQFPVKEGNWPAEVVHSMVVGPYVDVPDFQLSFHVAGDAPIPASLPLVRRNPRGAVTLSVLVLALIGLVSVARWAVSYAL